MGLYPNIASESYHSSSSLGLQRIRITFDQHRYNTGDRVEVKMPPPIIVM